MYDLDLVKILTMVLFGDLDDLEDSLQECKNTEIRDPHASMGPNKFRQRPTSQAAQLPSKRRGM